MGKKNAKPKQLITTYHLSVHYGVCAGPVDKMYRLFYGEKECWHGPLVSQAEVQVEVLDLMGGHAKEGGVSGRMHYLPGEDDQVLSQKLASKYSLSAHRSPGYRGLFSLFFTGPNNAWPQETARTTDTNTGFYWSSNSPYLQGIWVELQCIQRHASSYAWYPSKAMIPRIEDPVSDAVQAEVNNPRKSSYTGEATHPDNSLVLIEGVTGNDATKWDTYGNVAVRLEHIDQVLQIWRLPDGALTEVDSGGTNSITGLVSVHVTREGEIVCRDVDTGEFKFFDSFGTLVQTVTASTDFQFGGVTWQTQMDDIYIPGAGTYLVAFELDPFTGVGMHRLRKDGVDWVEEDAAPLTNVPITLSLGPDYAYGIRGNTWSDVAWVGFSTLVTSSIVRVDLFSLAETVVDVSVLAPLVTDIAVVHYDREADVVIVICRNGDMVSLSPDLSTIVATRFSATDDNNLEVGRDPLLCKRLMISASTFAVRHHPNTPASNVDRDVYKYSSPYLHMIQHIDASERDYPAHDQHFTFQANNEAWNGSFYPTHFFKSAFWFLGQPPRMDMNPAHIIFEALTNSRWGMGQPIGNIDVASFQEAADTLFAEQLGLSMMWTRQATIEKFVSEVLDHIEATLYIAPQTGLLTLKLLRDDYDPDDLEIYDEENSTVIELQRKTMADIINEVVVSYTDPENEQAKTVTRQDLAGIAAQGGIISDSRDYYGVRSATLAAKLGDRDLRAGSYPLMTGVVEVDRRGWDLVPGAVIKLSSLEHGVALIVMRVLNVDYGKPGEPRIRLELVEDIFALEVAEFVSPPAGSWVDPGENPQAMDFAKLLTAPYGAIAASGLADDMQFPESGVMVLGATGGQDTASYDLHGTVTNAAGVSSLRFIDTNTVVAWGLLGEPIVPEATTEFDLSTLEDVTQGAQAVVGGFALIGDSDEGGDELVLITRVFRGVATLQRGVLDTVPAHRAAGRSILFFGVGDKVYDSTVRSVGEGVRYKMLSRTSRGILPASAAPFIPTSEFVVSDRPYLPLRPANCKVEGVGFGAVDLSNQSPAVSEFEVTWARRNRLTEDSQPLAWDAADVEPEAGQLTRINVLDAYTRAVLHTYDEVAGTSQTVLLTDFQDGQSPPPIVVIIQFQSINTTEDPPLVCLQAHEITVVVDPGVDLLSISGTPVLTGQVGIVYEGFQVTVTGGAPPYIFTLEGDWPPGFEITQGVISASIDGLPEESGVFSTPGITVRVTDAFGDIDELTPFVIEIDEADTTAPILSNPTGGDVP